MKADQEDLARSWQEAKASLTYKQIAASPMLNPDGKGWKAISRAVERIEEKKRKPVQVLPQFSEVEYETPVIVTDNVIITSDVEVPDAKNIMLQLALGLGKCHNIKHKIIAGDLIASDQPGLTSFASTWQDGSGVNYEGAIRLVKQLLLFLLSWFSAGIWVIEGNHDDRVARATDGQIHLGMFLEELDVEYVRYYDLWISTSRGYVYVVHPRVYRKNSLSLAEEFWKITTAPDGSKPIAVVMAHTHQARWGWSPDGKCRLIALGCVRDPRKTKYIHQSGRPFPVWINSILMIKNAHFYPVDLDSDFDFWLGKYAKGIK